MPHYMLAVLTKGEHGDTISVLGEIAEETYRDVASAIAHLDTFVERETFKLVAHNHAEFLDVYQAADQGIPVEQVPRYLREVALQLRLRFLNWLFSVRLFLDHTETQLKRRYGKESDEAQAFLEACASEYDTHFTYRFCYKLRNYAQHCGMSAIGGEYKGRRNEDGSVEQRLHLRFDVQELLRNDANVFGAVVRDELRAGTPYIPVLQTVDDLMHSLARILETVMEIDKRDVDVSAVKVVAVRRAVGGHEGQPLIVAFDDQGTPVSTMPIPDISSDGVFIAAVHPLLAANINVRSIWQEERAEE